jgi:acetyl esterase/lipase
VTAPETDLGTPNPEHTPVSLTNVTQPTLTVYLPPPARTVHAAALVFPGGGYQRLAYTKEGLETCHWLNSLGMACLLVKYRVPQPSNDTGRYPADPADLEDAQQAMRLTRARAAEWHIDPAKIGVVGFSAGGNLAVLLSTHPDDNHIASTPAAADVPGVHGRLNGTPQLTDPLDAAPNFAIVIYPAYLAIPPAETALNPTYTPSRFTPPTFLLQAEDDAGYGHNALVYYRALMDAKVPAELHYFASGGHGFGMHPAGKPEEHWTLLAELWLRDLGILPIETIRHHLDDRGLGASTGLPIPTPCPNLQPSNERQPKPNPTDVTNANCF